MTPEELKNLSKEQAMDFIRERLTLQPGTLKDQGIHHSKPGAEGRLRFEMSGYESYTGECTLSNMEALNRFADLGLYDYTTYLFLDFHKGAPTLYLSYFWDEEPLDFNFSGMGTREIIYEILLLTVLSGKPARRRN
jgi:hypothetical protein